ncbi:disease resistance protein RPM1-like [Magnolia sinica]|uniref:disease resistance protein RPM1-like n=1 Tax=Magnolia sinica TaxID=86752 RepID=UPI00265859E8|nr:disease resistance protein RPM1-like [Magnolia sinica]XP_058111635.1 disease resistance protein RPM1-like [Magnolia sinica]XP_058111636.1 disease resistance protein RPM1-like [Magnolia sinica]XP_058111637.1 disease resistance protein RPM1-like [Magnolia sinica]XP_058111638.1 disease resistance protein RPM1-like [Magnolia sinica]XP_058111639.1 disease resistance protein RPM1-like [Magnolia sinica]
MTDSIVQFGLETLSALLSREASLIRGVRNEVEEIKLKLERMQALLKDADKRKESNEGVRTWVRQVRDSTYDVEDIIDEFMYRMDRPQGGGLRSFLLNIVCLPKNIYNKHCFAIRLQETKVKVHNLFDTGVAFGLNQIGEGTSSHDVSKMWQRDVETSLSLEEDDIVGMKKELDLIVRWLVEEEQRRTVISVTGMGGAGKTVLVTKVYKNKLVKKHFDCSACVSVSQTLRIDEVLRSIIKQFLEATKDVVPNDLATRDASDLRQMIKRHLESKRYLIVLDDIWRMNDWKELGVIFPDYRCGGRLVVTTRDSDVALAAGEGSRVCQLQPLHPEEAWQLFCKKAFRNKPCPSEQEPLALSIVEKCQGLPLAVIAMGSLLSLRDANVLEWNRVYNNLSWHLNNNEKLEPIKRILLLSFYYLPYRLKHCFLYCCMFPEDYLIRRNKLIRLWVAEGFVEDAGKVPMEEVAEDYLMELIHRNTLQVVKTNLSGRVIACQMHDIVRELALSLCDEEKFCITYDGQQTRQGGKVRRMSIYNSGETIQHSMSMSQLRSLLVFERSTSLSSSLNTIASSFMLLRVLDLQGVPIESLPDELTNLFNLRYLNLKNTNVGELPKCLGRLRNLQTLNVRETRIKTLPSGVVKLQKLRHLIGYRYNMEDLGTFEFASSIQVPIGICNITSLQSLTSIEAKEGEIVRQIGNLTQLRKLHLSKVRAINGAELCTSIAKLKYLVTLSVKAINEEEALQLEELSPDHLPLFQKLVLWGRLEKVPQWFRYLAHLTVLSLSWSKLREEDLLSSLQALPNLVRLFLLKAYEGQQLCFHDGWFPKLRGLELWYLTQLNRVVIEKGTLPSIQELTVFRCEELKTLPEGIEYLTKLRLLRLYDMPTELTERLQQKDGNEEDRRKVGHIPLIYGGRWKEEGWDVHRLN